MRMGPHWTCSCKSVTINVAAAMAGSLGLRTIVVDLDAQRNATTALLGRGHAGPTVADVLRAEVPLAGALVACHYPTLSVLPGDRDLTAYEMSQSDPNRGMTILAIRDLLARSIPEDTDVVLIDTPPSGGIWLQIALATANSYAMVANPDGFSADGLLELMDTARQVQEDYNPALARLGLVVNNVRNTGEATTYIAAFERLFGAELVRPILPQRGVIGQAREGVMPVGLYESNVRTSAAPAGELFRELAVELAGRMGLAARAPVAPMTAGLTPPQSSAGEVAA